MESMKDQEQYCVCKYCAIIKTSLFLSDYKLSMYL